MFPAPVVAATKPMSPVNRLLVLDDDPFVPRWIRKVAEHEGYEVSVCHDLATVRAVCRASQPTLIVMDLTLGGYQGLEALRMLAAEHCTTPVILTGSAEPGVLQSASRFGVTLDLSMAGIMPKPIELGQLRRMLAAHMQAPHDLSNVERILYEGGSAIIDEARVRQAFEAGELRVYYQPQMSLRSHAVTAIEALVRWEHPMRGLISPNGFLPLVEQADLMRALTFFVLETALDECHGWISAGQSVSVSVNLAPSLLQDADFPDAVEGLLDRIGVSPGALTLEIDESVVIGHTQEVADALTRLRLKGCRLALDNFGTGFSSLVELRHLPISQLKIGRAHVVEALTRQGARAIVEAVIEFGHRIGLQIVAEGVEDRETLDLLQAAGCDLAQGFLISRPIDAAALADLLAASRPARAGGAGGYDGHVRAHP